MLNINACVQEDEKENDVAAKDQVSGTVFNCIIIALN